MVYTCSCRGNGKLLRLNIFSFLSGSWVLPGFSSLHSISVQHNQVCLPCITPKPGIKPAETFLVPLLMLLLLTPTEPLHSYYSFVPFHMRWVFYLGHTGGLDDINYLCIIKQHACIVQCQSVPMLKCFQLIKFIWIVLLTSKEFFGGILTIEHFQYFQNPSPNRKLEIPFKNLS